MQPDAKMRTFRALANAARDRTRSVATSRPYANARNDCPKASTKHHANARRRLSDGLDPADREAGPSLRSGFGLE